MMKRSSLKIIPIYDGKQEAIEVFTDLIAAKIQVAKQKDDIVKRQDMNYNEDAVHCIELASGLCG